MTRTSSVHEIAHDTDPNARVAYIDFEPVAVAHAQQLLADVTGLTVTRADPRDPERVPACPGVADLLDFARPVAVLLVAVLHFVARDTARVLDACRDALAPGSATELTLRTRTELLDLLTSLDGTELVAPGLVDVTDWPTAAIPPAPVAVYGAVTRLDHERRRRS